VLVTLLLGASISMDRLCAEAFDLDRLARSPEPAFAAAQASSFDRASTEPGKESWFANGDAGHFVDTVRRGNRTEFVLTRLQGPGVVTRFWSANPVGTLRMRFDGEEDPRLECRLADWLSGGFGLSREPWSYRSAGGWNSYLPIPFSRSLEITVDDSEGDQVRWLYYHVGYRRYGPHVAVASPTADELREDREASIAGLAEGAGRTVPLRATVGPGEAVRLAQVGGPAIGRVLELRVAPDDPRLLRWLWLQIRFDGKLRVSAPIGDFFVSGTGIRPFRTLPFEARPDGTMVCRFAMPFRSRAEVVVRNAGSLTARIEGVWTVQPARWDPRLMHFSAAWRSERRFTRPFADLPLLDVPGPGVLVGCALHVANPVAEWWGEGDERIWIDGERFPSFFGTGTEDFFGYGWGSMDEFERPFHAQVRNDRLGGRGHIVLCRWFVADPIPFRDRIRFDLELWHWAETALTMARTIYWYTAPNCPEVVQASQRAELPPDVSAPPEPPGTWQAERLEWQATGGRVQVQRGIGDTSEGGHLWWTYPEVGDVLRLRVPVTSPGRYRLDARVLFAPDYGSFELAVDGRRHPWPYDFFAPRIEVRTLPFSTWELKPPSATIEWRCVGSHPRAQPGRMLGLDTLRLVPVP